MLHAVAQQCGEQATTWADVSVFGIFAALIVGGIWAVAWGTWGTR